jgi:hypothetical protein
VGQGLLLVGCEFPGERSDDLGRCPIRRHHGAPWSRRMPSGRLPRMGGGFSRLPQCPCPTASAHEAVDAKPIGLKPSSTRRGISGLGMSGLRLARGLQSSCPVEGQPAMDSRCKLLSGAFAAMVAPMRRVSPAGLPSAPQRWQRATEVSAHIGRRLPSGPVRRPAWRGTSEVSAHIGSSLPWTSRQSRPSVSQLVIRPSAPTPGPSPLEGGAHIGLWPPWVTRTKGHLLPRANRHPLL